MIVTSKANSILNDLFKNGYYIGLSTTTPTATGGNISEPLAKNGYKRVKLTCMGEADSAKIQNTDIIFFPESTGDWGTITHFFVCASETSTPHYWGELTPAGGVAIPEGYVPIFRAGALKIGLDRDAL